MRVPVARQKVTRCRRTPLRAVLTMLKFRYHEEGLLAVLLFVGQRAGGDAGKKDRICSAHDEFLKSNCNRMPRTMSRYTIGKLPAVRRKACVNGTL